MLEGDFVSASCRSRRDPTQRHRVFCDNSIKGPDADGEHPLGEHPLGEQSKGMTMPGTQRKVWVGSTEWSETRNQSAMEPSGVVERGVCGERHYEPHAVERGVHETLRKLPNVRFGSLEVHCVNNAVCVAGVMTVHDDGTELQIDRVIRTAAGALLVVNRLMIKISAEDLASPGGTDANGISFEDDSMAGSF